ncbi:phosphoesterase [Corynebacterium sp. H128]|uniref:phosphoesterase n=1 Tax=Corynebacterium sp. H128 TaxID=3133427 RepID=UPI0030AF5849
MGIGALCALFTSILPMAWILLLQKRGRVSSHHVTQRSHRGPIFMGIALLLGVLIGVLIWLEADLRIWTAVFAALGFILMFALVTVVLKTKISVHVGLWLTVTGYLAVVVHPLWWTLFALTPLIAWARVRISHHTVPEILGGAVAGLAILTIACAF